MNISEIEQRLPLICKAFQTEPAVGAAYLFGSVAAGRATWLSDVDFAVLLRQDVPDGLDRWALLGRLGCALAKAVGASDQTVDVVSLNDVGLVFRNSVLQRGKLIYEADRKARQLFEWGVICRYLDFKPTLDIYDRARLKRLLTA